MKIAILVLSFSFGLSSGLNINFGLNKMFDVFEEMIGQELDDILKIETVI